MNTDAIRGHLEMLLLAALEPGEAYGYALIERVAARSGQAFELTEGSVYPALHRLEAAGDVQSHWERVSGRRRRVYKLTRAGQARLGHERTEWARFSYAVSLAVNPA